MGGSALHTRIFAGGSTGILRTAWSGNEKERLYRTAILKRSHTNIQLKYSISLHDALPI